MRYKQRTTSTHSTRTTTHKRKCQADQRFIAKLFWFLLNSYSMIQDETNEKEDTPRDYTKPYHITASLGPPRGSPLGRQEFHTREPADVSTTEGCYQAGRVCTPDEVHVASGSTSSASRTPPCDAFASLQGLEPWS